jgi:hypothetical protein
MAMLIKKGARKPRAIGSVSVGYGNFACQGLLTNKHICLTLGDFMLRIELKDAEELADRILNYYDEFGE